MTDWKRKLAAYLHDPPSKCLDIGTHGERSDAAFRQAGFTDTEVGEYFKHADHTGAAADRFPFPQYRAAGLACHFDGLRNAFHHPLEGAQQLPFKAEFKSVEQGFEGENSVQPALQNTPPDWGENTLWRARFFAHWRCWPQFATEKDYRLGLLPADTRLPDHSIWTHMQVVSALAGCVDNNVWRPAFLKLQLGPVQEFIAQARSTRDLWSGSYLLSWLMAAGLKKFSELAGPDAVIYPSLRGQPLFDLHWKKELWEKVFIGGKPVWESIQPTDKEQDLLTPNLPNVFLALVPGSRGREIAKEVEKAIREELENIAKSVWTACDKAGLTNNEGDPAFHDVDRKARFDRQIERFLSITWQVTPWPATPEKALKLTEHLPLGEDDQKHTLRDRFQAVIKAACEEMPKDHRDHRYYTDENKTQLNNVGVAWALLVALNSWQLDAVRQTRNFAAWSEGGWQTGAACNKDSLTGKDEAVAGGKIWLERCDTLAGRKEGSNWHAEHGPVANRFKHDDWLGAVTLVKRLWDLTYLKPEFGLKPLPMPNTHGLAKHEPFSNDDDEREASERQEGERYFAVLALDGDQIGKWVAGDKCPPFRSQLAAYTDGNGNPAGALEYFERNSDPDNQGTTLKQRFAKLLDTRRPISPSYHLQFSEALSNFALLCARPIVEAFDGRLIYSGGDDVLALLPADTALDCARALRMAFTGDVRLPEFLKTASANLKQANEAAKRKAPYYQLLAAENCLFESLASGFLARKDRSDQTNQKPIPSSSPAPLPTARSASPSPTSKTRSRTSSAKPRPPKSVPRNSSAAPPSPSRL
ncbi:MAG: type III-B CRISPR-associated protein Cas10/Cmr2 [Verrucomicrobia bacterium]|nr:type III-B CRISPR-associated protein Cas10/Cmr2 [Verrucomicrobiota bacterium]